MQAGTIWNTEGFLVTAENEHTAREAIQKYGFHPFTGEQLWEFSDAVFPVDDIRGTVDIIDYYTSLRDKVMFFARKSEVPLGSYSFYAFDVDSQVTIVGGIIVNEKFIKMIEMDNEGTVESNITKF